MKDNFRILIAYDGSGPSDAALDDLVKAGLPEKGVEALVVSVAEVWLPPQMEDGVGGRNFIRESVRKKYEENMEALEEAGKLSAAASARIIRIFPGWQVNAKSTYGSPAWEILSVAEEMEADLIIVGAKGRSAIERVLLGSVSQKVVTEAKCPVRVSRGSVEVDASQTRVLIGYDGSEGARYVVRTVVGRNWRRDAKVKVVIVEDTVFLRSSLAIAVDKIEKVGADLVGDLKASGLDAVLSVVEGNPKHDLIAQADDWNADCIFIGATQFNDLCTKYLLGSVTSAVVTRAECSVEVVRPISYGAQDRNGPA